MCTGKANSSIFNWQVGTTAAFARTKPFSPSFIVLNKSTYFLQVSSLLMSGPHGHWRLCPGEGPGWSRRRWSPPLRLMAELHHHQIITGNAPASLSFPRCIHHLHWQLTQNFITDILLLHQDSEKERECVKKRKEKKRLWWFARSQALKTGCILARWPEPVTAMAGFLLIVWSKANSSLTIFQHHFP